MKKVYGYIRVSTVKQSDGASLDTQKEAIISYANKNQLNIIEWLEEKQTAAKQGRPLFKKMLANLKKNKADGAIIFKIDRSSRNLREWEDLKDVAKSKDIHFANDNINLRSNSGVLTGDFMAVIASNYVRNMLEDSRRGFYGRLKQGLYPLNAPLGYLNMGSGKLKQMDKNVAPLVKQMFEMYCYGNYSVEVLRKKMYEKGLKNSKGKPYSKSSVYSILNNSFYMGMITLQTTKEVFVGKHKPLISKRLFEQVQAKLKGKQVKHQTKHNHMFRKLIKCSCGYTISGERQKGRVYYRCHNKDCSETTIREDKIFWTIIGKIKSIDLSTIERNALKDFLDGITQGKLQEKENQIKNLELRLSNIKSRADNLLNKSLDGLIDDNLYKAKNKEIVLEEVEIQRKINNIKHANTDVQLKAANFFELTGNLYLSYIRADKQKKALIAKNLFSNLVLKDGKLVISTNFPYYLFEKPDAVCYCATPWDTLRTIYPWKYDRKYIAKEIYRWLSENNSDD